MPIVQAIAMSVLQLLAAGAGCQMDDMQMSKSSASNTELFAVSGTPEFGRRLCLMSSDGVIIDAIKMAQRLLWQNLPPTHGLPDASTVMRFRDLVRSPAHNLCWSAAR
jgi:hypothetical protein